MHNGFDSAVRNYPVSYEYNVVISVISEDLHARQEAIRAIVMTSKLLALNLKWCGTCDFKRISNRKGSASRNDSREV